MKPFKKEHAFECNNEKLYIYTMEEKRDVIDNMKALKKIKPKVNKEKYKQVFNNYIGLCTKMRASKETSIQTW